MTTWNKGFMRKCWIWRDNRENSKNYLRSNCFSFCCGGQLSTIRRSSSILSFFFWGGLLFLIYSLAYKIFLWLVIAVNNNNNKWLWCIARENETKRSKEGRNSICRASKPNRAGIGEIQGRILNLFPSLLYHNKTETEFLDNTFWQKNFFKNFANPNHNKKLFSFFFAFKIKYFYIYFCC